MAAVEHDDDGFDDGPPPGGLSHFVLGASLALALVGAVPGAAVLALLGVGQVVGAQATAGWAVALVYGWLFTAWLAQIPLLAPAVAAAIGRRHLACALGLVLAAVGVGAADLAFVAGLAATGSLDPVWDGLRPMVAHPDADPGAP